MVNVAWEALLSRIDLVSRWDIEEGKELKLFFEQSGEPTFICMCRDTNAA